MVLGRADVSIEAELVLGEMLEQLRPELPADLVARLGGMGDFGRLLLLHGQGDEEILVLRRRDHLIHMQVHLLALLPGRDLEALNLHLVPQKPKRGGGHLLAEVDGHQDDPLLLAGVELDFLEVLAVHELADLFLGIAAAVLGEVLLVDVGDLHLAQVGAIAGVLEGLPHDIAAGIVELVLDEDQPPLLVERQQVEALAGLVEAVEFLLDDEQFLPQRLGGARQPLLQMLALLDAQRCEGGVGQGGEGFFIGVEEVYGGYGEKAQSMTRQEIICRK